MSKTDPFREYAECCEKLMRLGTIEVANGEEHTKLACAECGTEVTQSKVLFDQQ